MRSTRLRGARTHNLRALDLDLEPGTLVAIAGPSGAGKSSLAFGTLYAEGQRRYVESFSAYARQFLERLARPPVDRLEPVAAGIAVDRQAPVRTSRSTVGTMTEVADYAKSLWARAAQLHCRQCGERVIRDEPEAIADALLASHAGAKLLVTYPVPVRDAEGFLGVREMLAGAGYRRVLIDGAVRDLDEVRPSDVLGDEVIAAAPKKKVAKKKATKKKAAPEPEPALRTVEVVADRTVLREEERGRIVEALEAAMTRGHGRAAAVIGSEVHRYSRALHCARCDIGYRDATPGLFSFNSAVGACESCRGFGRVIGVDWAKVLPDPKKTLGGGAIAPWGGKSTAWERRALAKHAVAAGVPLDVPIAQLTEAQREWLMEGDELGYPRGWFGLRGWFGWLESRAYKMHVRVLLSRYRSYEDCTACGGARLKPDALLWKIDGRSIAEMFAMPASDARVFLDRVEPVIEVDAATLLLLRECRDRLRTLEDVGLGYLQLDRASRTLSGGESQRVSLTSALSASLTGAMFVLDEPTVGLHPSDVRKLSRVVERLAEDDNLVLVVEHDPDVIRAADRVIELGPGAGEHGGAIVFDGTPDLLAQGDTATAHALREDARVVRDRRITPSWLVLRGARGHNLQQVELRIPVGAMTCVTGPSGSGKSSLVLETLVPAVQRALGVPGVHQPLEHDALEGAALVSSVVHVDQSPLGRTSRGNAATYLGAWDVIRKRFAREPIAKERGYTDGFFSFNVEGGRCETCRGDGAETVEMQFLADVTFSCPDCSGRRFVGPVLDVVHRGMTVADVLELTANEAAERFAGDASVSERLRPMIDVGLGYLKLGQSLNTLSGGEAQRLKLALALAETPPGALVVLDEPTAGLHAKDVEPLMQVLDRLVARGDTVVVVEHDMRVAARADRVIDLGPGAGNEGGRIVAAGTPEEVANVEGSRTAEFLARALGRGAPEKVSRTRTTKSTSTDARVIEVVNAHEHNLRNVSVRFPREKLVAVTGPSGSGKSTLAFDVVFAEGQRRYLETLSPYARQYLPQLPRPAVDRVVGVPPTVSVEQRITRGGANSTVATVTEVAHYLRLLWARAGLLHCTECEVPIAARAPGLLTEDVLARFGAKAEITVLAPIVRGRKGHHRELLGQMRDKGFTEARIDGVLRTLEPGLSLARFVEHEVDVVVDRAKGDRAKLEAALRRAAELGEGSVRVLAAGEDLLLSTKRACPSCGKGYPELDPRFFSFNTRQGQCEGCEGKGFHLRTIGKGKTLREVREACEDCGGTRLSKLARSVTIDERPITALLSQSVEAARRELSTMTLKGREKEIGEPCLHESEARLRFLEEVGLGYLGLDRPADTLSGGETQRVRLAAQLGSGLTGLLYVLDEPTIGLHPRDTGKLVGALRSLVDKGNSVIVVEHDTDVIRAAEHVVDVGPGGGKRGGRVLAEGAPAVLETVRESITGASIARAAHIPSERRDCAKAPRLELEGARGHNLKSVDVSIPLGRLVVVSGVSGSGKSTLVRRVLLPAVRDALGLVNDEPGLPFAKLRGADKLQRATMVDQSPIGRTPRSVPATYVGVWDEIRRLLAQTPEARARGWDASRFSFNVSHGGRCPTCEGNGSLTVEMAFLPDVYLPCDGCRGMRFTQETLDARLHDRSAGELLKMEIEEAAKVLSAVPKVARPLELLAELGLGYLELGQASNTLSGGEAQRLKLVAELGTAAQGKTLYVLDEPTTGLHRDDVGRLIGVLGKFVERGDTVVVIEHHPDVILQADWVIDLGPEGGQGGGTIVVQGTPEEVAACERSHTGRALREEYARAGIELGAKKKTPKRKAS
ncbi:excinuclease ABC subunit UvrA [Sandaracinus amylolyticus]|uniref:excinuclease ABC subunit UvrA n=1 Tax=Sandaracinus amylolyticus TaxID=927083 RepID=UPI001F0157F9|nr:excinuclease ABC subunit UvrA [Sandaracinus amylolyticus]UJR80228.1 Excinuclease ABC subunit A [Sandaracinus amylolyticus]